MTGTAPWGPPAGGPPAAPGGRAGRARVVAVILAGVVVLAGAGAASFALTRGSTVEAAPPVEGAPPTEAPTAEASPTEASPTEASPTEESTAEVGQVVRCGVTKVCSAWLTTTAVVDALTAAGYQCDPGKAGHWRCGLDVGASRYALTMNPGDDAGDERIWSLGARVTIPDDTEPTDATLTYLSWVASLPFADDQATVTEVTTWVSQLVDGGEGAEATIGDFEYLVTNSRNPLGGGHGPVKNLGVLLSGSTLAALDLPEEADSSAGAAPAPVALELPAAFPVAGQRFIQGLAVSQLTELRLEQGVTWAACRTMGEGVWTEVKQWLQCGAADGGVYGIRMNVESDDETHVTRVEAKCLFWEEPGPSSGSPVCRSLFAEVAAAAVSGQPELRQQARDWAVQNMDSDTATTIGGVRLAVVLDPATFLITPVA